MFKFDNTYARLPERFYARVKPTPVGSPQLVKLNLRLAEQLGAHPEQLSSVETAKVLAGNEIPPGAEPLALAYAGHQFGSFVPQLGDGRAILLGEVIGKDGRRWDIQLKGAGRTPFSRGGDGRAALGPVLREYVVSEAMAAFGVQSTRALAAVTTGERVARDRPLPGAVFTRVAASHIRVGTFQFFAARHDREALEILVAYALARHYPGSASGRRDDALVLLDRAISAQASLVAQWMGVGFVHGVMNTDNTAISGETIDFGPCAFLDEYDSGKTFSSIDHGGRYAFSNQPLIAHWNLVRLAEALLPLFADDEETAVRLATLHLQRFGAQFEDAYLKVFRAKLGLVRNDDGDRALAETLLDILEGGGVDFTLFFRRLCAAAADPESDAEVESLFGDPARFRDWARSWRKRLALDDLAPEARAEAMRRANPAFIPRNHRIEEAISAAVDRGDFQPFHRLVEVLARPYDDQPEQADLTAAPRPEERVLRTFCGT